MKDTFYYLIAFVAGVLFAVGLAVGGMLQPGNVRAFLDVFGAWNPKLLGVMIGAIAVYGIANQVAVRMARPLNALDWSELPKPGFCLTKKVLMGNVLFGVGWGLSGYCPGPAIASLPTGAPSVVVFVGAMVSGFIVWETVLKKI